MRLRTAAEMRARDRATIDGGHATGAELMDRAGHGAVEAIERRWGSPVALRVLVLCGSGNNGGDGLVAARHLAARGAAVRVAVLAARERVGGDAAVHLARLEAAGVRPAFIARDEELAPLAAPGAGWDLALDALLGTGASGPPRGLLAGGCALLAGLRARGTRVVALDLPSGVSADDGSAAPGAVHADLTVTFGDAKRGHWLHPGREHCGALEVVEIGLLPEPLGTPGVALADAASLAARVPRRGPRAHKGDTGRVLIVGGALGMAGAVILAARAAARAGAGYVRVAAPASLHDALVGPLLEAMPVACGEGVHRTLTLTALPVILAEAARAGAVALGPGLSRQADAERMARALLPALRVPVVLDADGLNAFAPPGGDLAAALRGGPPCVLTPHLGEMSRLTGERAPALEARRIDAAREWAARWGCVVLLKGAPTVVAAPDGRTSVNPTGNPGMASAGMGDVLTGAIAALIAQGLAPFEAAVLGAHVHGLAGDRAAADIGALGVLAGDVLERLPGALSAVAAAG